MEMETSNGLKTVEVEWKKIPGERPQLIEIEGSEKEWPCELALLALGFTGPEKTVPEQFGLTYDARGNIKGETTTKPQSKIFLPRVMYAVVNR